MLDTMCLGLLAGVAGYPAYKVRRRAREVAAFMAMVRARRKGDAVCRDASVTPEVRGVRAAGDIGHGSHCAPTLSDLTGLSVGGETFPENGVARPFRNAGVTGPGA